MKRAVPGTDRLREQKTIVAIRRVERIFHFRWHGRGLHFFEPKARRIDAGGNLRAMGEHIQVYDLHLLPVRLIDGGFRCTEG